MEVERQGLAGGGPEPLASGLAEGFPHEGTEESYVKARIPPKEPTIEEKIAP